MKMLKELLFLLGTCFAGLGGLFRVLVEIGVRRSNLARHDWHAWFDTAIIAGLALLALALIVHLLARRQEKEDERYPVTIRHRGPALPPFRSAVRPRQS